MSTSIVYQCTCLNTFDFSDLLHIHSNCRTPEKMALTLLDYLFDRETQAISNLSGQGKHGKKQLDPLMIYGIRCKYKEKMYGRTCRMFMCAPTLPVYVF